MPRTELPHADAAAAAAAAEAAAAKAAAIGTASAFAASAVAARTASALAEVAAAEADPTVKALAERFAAEVRRVTTPSELAWIAAENARRRASGDLVTCASGDIYDSNESLDTAFHAVLGRDIDSSSEEDTRMCNAAWRWGMAELAHGIAIDAEGSR